MDIKKNIHAYLFRCSLAIEVEQARMRKGGVYAKPFAVDHGKRILAAQASYRKDDLRVGFAMDEAKTITADDVPRLRSGVDTNGCATVHTGCVCSSGMISVVMTTVPVIPPVVVIPTVVIPTVVIVPPSVMSKW